MQLGLENYTSFKVKNVKRIKGNYGFLVVLKYDDETEKTQQHAGFSNKEDAEKAREIIIGKLHERKYLVYGSILFKDYVRHWLDDDIKMRVGSYNTYYSYNSVVNNHIVSVLGNKMMKMINSADIVRLYKKVGDYSSSVAEQVKTIMKTCLDFAASEKAVETNMALGVRMPKKAKTNNYHSRTIEVEKTLTKEQVFKLIEGSKNSKIYLMLLFNVVMGLRCSEIIGIKYSDIDFINQKLTIRRQLGRDIKKDDSELDAKTLTKQEVRTKTPSSVRTIDIPDIVYEAILKQRKYYQACKSRRKTAFQDLGYVCCSSYGRPRSKNYHYEHFKQLLKELDLPDVRWHDLRGTCATLLLMQGISPKAIAKNLGHSTEIVTVDNYIDKSKLSVIKLDKLDSFIDSVVPKTNCEEEDKDFSKVIIDVSEFF